ncbi:DUF932 domain-containing protein [Streptomyces lydicus]|uniref:DUF932 domain-containing protein n=1 Tax=Streptomyces lydicus TaxID=47763 RepID=UPI0036E3379E
MRIGCRFFIPNFLVEGFSKMSRETLKWLNENTLIGFTDKRGKAWHHRAGSTNHYSGPVPLEEVESRLFAWTAEERPLFTGKKIGIPDFKAIVRSDTGLVMGVFKQGYQPHQPKQWLLENVSTILDDELAIGSAGLLRGGAQAWVSVEVPDTIQTPEGVKFRPNLIAATSFDGSLSTVYKRIVTNVVCDNTMNAGLREDGQQFRVKHSSKSLYRLTDARSALAIVHSVGDEFGAAVAKLCAQHMVDREFERLVREQLAPIETGDSRQAERNARRKQGELLRLWRQDERVAPWRGTKFGAYQAVSTWQQHEARIRSKNRAARNMGYTLTGKWEAADDTTLSLLAAV